jgi:predicted DNA-binding transcriptional regulator AlpA
MRTESKLDVSVGQLAENLGAQIAARIVTDLRRGSVPILPEYLTALQVSQLTGFSVKALEKYRATGEGPKYLRVGSSIRYRVDDVRKWMETSDDVEP